MLRYIFLNSCVIALLLYSISPIESSVASNEEEAFSKLTSVIKSKWFIAKVVTMKLMSNEIEILVLGIKIYLVFSCCLYCSFCRQCEDLFGRNAFFVSLDACLFTYEAAIEKGFYTTKTVTKLNWHCKGSYLHFVASDAQKSWCSSVLAIDKLIKCRAFSISVKSYKRFIFYVKWYCKIFSPPARLK